MRLTEKIDSLYLEHESISKVINVSARDLGAYYYNTGEYYSLYYKLECLDFEIDMYEYLEELKIELE